MQHVKAAAERQGKPQGMRERLGAGFGEIGRVSDSFYRFLHQNLLPGLGG